MGSMEYCLFYLNHQGPRNIYNNNLLEPFAAAAYPANYKS